MSLCRAVLRVLAPTYHVIHIVTPHRQGEWCIAISMSVCLCLSVCLYLSVWEHICGTAGPTFTKFCMQIPCGCGSVLFWRRCDTLCSSGFIDVVTFDLNGPYVDSGFAIPGRSLMSVNALLLLLADTFRHGSGVRAVTSRQYCIASWAVLTHRCPAALVALNCWQMAPLSPTTSFSRWAV